MILQLQTANASICSLCDDDGLNEEAAIFWLRTSAWEPDMSAASNLERSLARLGLHPLVHYPKPKASIDGDKLGSEDSRFRYEATLRSFNAFESEFQSRKRDYFLLTPR
ncbi:hypothetical protein CVT26_008975 [Gymnopilus dilepis]|uniref:Uncharacterized protein n=1 Tax=Gymnopilus dilepis TaxID=231916 RepID=A0A409YIQ0_9AGAR|nr:hypothetical protein CVT26_008975 [Gymnopilus dilepis]